eukprot:TRINITY_DN7408_c0_g1_i1.p1 TRINITY_DN7408_c0_g1~~TRINITY_DN7408_c0_g1_i1.p1  ORF type:complete len:355 (-),score=31.75 TRINITY_DN7408_c0_g1_i1:69-1133(-)
MYQDTFTPKGNCRVQSYKPLYSTLDPSKFEGDTTNHNDFKKHPFSQTVSCRPAYEKEKLNPEDRDFLSEQKKNFQYHGNVSRQPIIPNRHTWEMGKPFDSTSTNRTDFNLKNGRPSTPFQPKSVFDPQKDDRDFESESRQKYKPSNSRPPAPFKPYPSQPLEQHKFDPSTTNRLDFQNWKGAQPPQNCKKKETLNVEKEDRDFLSDYKKEFAPKKSDTVRVRPEAQLYDPSKDDRDWATENRSSLQKYPYCASKSFIPPQQMLVTGAFHPDTTSRSAYVPHSQLPAISYKPKSLYSENPDTRDFLSETRQKYQPNPILICPSGGLPGRFTKSKPGHLFYRPLSSGGGWEKLDSF